MRQLTLLAGGQVRWRRAPAPVLAGPQAALVRPVAVSVCDFDRAMIAGRLRVLPPPIALGHEIVAEVVAAGDQVRSAAAGDRVILPLQVSCGSCGPCRAGRSNSCQAVGRVSNYGLGAGGGDYGGGMSDLLAVPYADAMLVPVPEGLSAVDVVAVGCNLVDAYRCLAPPAAAPGADVLVVGGYGATFALYVVAMARVLGAGGVDYVGEEPDQLARAEALGARPLRPGERLRKGGYGVVCDLSLDPRQLARGAAACAPDGVVMVPWFYPDPGTPLPLGAMFTNNVTLVTGQPHARGLIEPVVELIRAGAITSTTIPCEVLAWEQADAHYGQGTTKRIFVR
jgi:threonine dehydrogenase-like Zn-dependent dehydrogenase